MHVPGPENYAAEGFWSHNSGKTLSGSNWVLEQALTYPNTRWAVVAPTYGQVQKVCFKGDALALGTYIPTPSGSVTMGDIRRGDLVLGGDGSPARVTDVYDVMTRRDCYRVTFKGGAQVTADGEHKWLVHPYLNRVYQRRGRNPAPVVMKTRDMIPCLRHSIHGRNGNFNYAVAVAKSSYSDSSVSLPVDPYTLGYWLGDGTSKCGEVTTMDTEVLDNIRAAGYEITEHADNGSHGKARTYGVLGLFRQLRLAGLLRNKHVPAEYLRASYEDRLAVLQGLMDSDGHVTESGQCEFANKNPDLINAVVDLLGGLGVKASAPRVKSARGFEWQVVRFKTTVPVFRILRKAQRIPVTCRDADYWVITSIDPVESVPVRCISVDSPDHTYLVTRHHIATHNSGIIAQALPGEIPPDGYNKNELTITLDNGSEIHGFSAENPERARGFNLSGAWLDEVGSFRGTELWDEVLQPALRKGDPKVVVTTTPSASLLLKRWYDLFISESKAGRPCDVHLTHSTFRENYALPPKRVEALEKEYAGTRAGRQELEGEMLEDFEGALWKREFIENHRVRPEDFDIDKMTRIVVAVDPSMTSGEKADESGIVVAAMDSNKEGYLIADLSCHGTPERVMREAVAAYYKYGADCVVMEANQGGDYLTTALRAVDPGVPPRVVRAQKGKLIRAQPISMLAEQGRLHHVGYFSKLEDQLCLAGSTLVTVPGGVIPIESVVAGGEVLTRSGWRKVTSVVCTGIRETIEIETGAGNLVCTPDHLVFTEKIGWIEAGFLRPGDKLVTCLEKLSDLTSNSTAKNISLRTTDITGQVVLGEDGSCTVTSGKIPTGLSLTDITSTIGTMSGATTNYPISLRSPLLTMFAPTGYAERGHSPGNHKHSSPEKSGNDENWLDLFQRAGHAWDAETKSSLTVPILQNTVVENVRNGLNIVEPVYDLTVEDAHEFFANGILVHNCIMTPDNKREHDDRADAFVWAFSELRGITEGSYLDAYGYMKCESCQYTYNKSHGQCPRCGFKPAREEKPQSPGDWAKAYKNTCRKCGTVYPQREAVCPGCQPNPFAYMAKVAQLTGGQGSWVNYQGKTR